MRRISGPRACIVMFAVGCGSNESLNHFGGCWAMQGNGSVCVIMKGIISLATSLLLKISPRDGMPPRPSALSMT